jgi:hypothetical protein
MTKRQDPEKLSVYPDPDNGAVFVMWIYDAGTSGTLSLSRAAAKDLAASLVAAAGATP